MRPICTIWATRYMTIVRIGGQRIGDCAHYAFLKDALELNDEWSR